MPAASRAEFEVQDQSFSVELDSPLGGNLAVRSSPRPYDVSFWTAGEPRDNLLRAISRSQHPLLIADRRVYDMHLAADGSLEAVPHFFIDAREESKGIETALSAVDFLIQNGATKASMAFVIGGGIVQDVGAFACAMLKRGIPWTFVPTTLLAQGDSCVGSKTALNYGKTKNVLALFSAPWHVMVDVGFLQTLPAPEILSGLGEIFRLLVTGGPSSLATFERDLPGLAGPDRFPALLRMIRNALTVKRAIVEFDEFELDLRRSMNYGHSFGHALEALTGYAIPHGTAVTIGMLVENELARESGMLNRDECDRLLRLGARIIPDSSRAILADLPLDGILDFLKMDKKTRGDVLTIATLESIGRMRFIDFRLDGEGIRNLQTGLRNVTEAIALTEAI